MELKGEMMESLHIDSIPRSFLTTTILFSHPTHRKIKIYSLGKTNKAINSSTAGRVMTTEAEELSDSLKH